MNSGTPVSTYMSKILKGSTISDSIWFHSFEKKKKNEKTLGRKVCSFVAFISLVYLARTQISQNEPMADEAILQSFFFCKSVN